MIVGHRVSRFEMTTSMAYSHFVLTTPPADDGEFDLDQQYSEASTALGLAGSDGIGQAGHTLVVCSPRESAFDMPVIVETWDDNPVDDLDEWGEAFEADIAVLDAGLRMDSPTLEGEHILFPRGHYRIRIAGRGFAPYGQDEIPSNDEWRLQLWLIGDPRAERTSPRRLRRWAGPRSS